jgi:hypothetical protein
MTAEIPSDDELIYDLIESFGHLWYPEPPLYSCYCDVAAIKEVEDKVRLAEVVTLNGFRCTDVHSEQTSSGFLK